MDQSTPRAERLQAIRDKWFSGPINVQFPTLVDDPSVQPPPANAHELVTGTHVSSSFSTLRETPELAGMTLDEAIAHDRTLNAQRFSVEDPQALLRDLSRQFDRAVGGQVDPTVLKKGISLLDAVRQSNLELADEYGAAKAPSGSADEETNRLLRQSHLADAEAVAQAQGLVRELAGELGISLPLSRGADRGR